YNGEIYNYLELRQELEREGLNFKSNSDTEVLLAAYHRWGEACLSKFNGMWAFAIYDKVEATLFLSRDRFGIKPLYYAVERKKGELYFASEIKQVLKLRNQKNTINKKRAYDFLVHGISDHSEETLFSNIFQVKGGETLTIDLKKDLFPQRKSWYQIPNSPHSGGEELVEKFNQLLTESIKLRLRADVAVGSCLSGGLDSSTIVCMVDQLLKGQNSTEIQHTFSACSKHIEYDERRFMDAVIEKTGVTGHFVYPDSDQLFENIDQLLWHQDEPFGSTSIFAQWEVFKLARENGVKVMLDGQGADELLAGYHPFFKPHLFDLLKNAKLPSLIRELGSLKKNHGIGKTVLLESILLHGFSDGLSNRLRNISGKNPVAPSWINSSFFGVTPYNPRSYRAHGIKNLNDLSRNQVLKTNLPMLFHYEDRNSMAQSVESRVPFLDHNLVEFSLNLPSEMKIHRGETKAILRRATKELLPSSVHGRQDKMGFVTPEQIWFREKAGYFKAGLKTSVERFDGALSNEFVQNFEGFLDGRGEYTFAYWRFFSFSRWMEVFDCEFE
ncbi:MAG: asparagine synthase (glutamine-hydrolyzing), partial [Halobacteriovoraceae bacterium]|nr:asparagine synthase (glutamine-hydrolyzing) [Halobacteriovoraceae bacterium]